MYDPNLAVLEGLALSNSTLANFEKLALEQEVPAERKPKVMKVETREGTTNYTLLYPLAGLLIVARVEEVTPTITNEKIVAAGGMVMVEAVNLRARTWKNKQGELRLSITADKITPVVPTAPTTQTNK